MPLVATWFLVVQLTWIFSMGFFRASGIGEGTAIILNAMQGLTTLPFSGLDFSAGSDLIVLGLWFSVPVWLLHIRTLLAEHSALGVPKLYEPLVYAGIMLAALPALYNSNQQFIYFQF